VTTTAETEKTQRLTKPFSWNRPSRFDLCKNVFPDCNFPFTTSRCSVRL